MLHWLWGIDAPAISQFFVLILNKTKLEVDYQQEARSAGIVFTHGPTFGFSPRTVTGYTDQGKIWQGGADLVDIVRIVDMCTRIKIFH